MRVFILGVPFLASMSVEPSLRVHSGGTLALRVAAVGACAGLCAKSGIGGEYVSLYVQRGWPTGSSCKH